MTPAPDKDNPAPFPNWINDASWEFVKFTTAGGKGAESAQFYLPGVCTIDGLKLGIDVDLQKKRGEDKGKPRDCGQTPIQFKIIVELIGNDWQAWLKVLPALLPNPGVVRKVLTIENPIINLNNISQIYVGRIEYDPPSGRKGMKIEITLHEYVDQPQIAKVKKPAEVAQDNAPARQIAVDNIMNQTFPGSPKPAGPTPEELGYGPPDLIRGLR